MSRLRGLLATQVDQAIERAIASYHAFAASGPEAADAKEFAAHHAACRAALAHLDLLLRIAKITEIPAPEAPDGDQRLALVAEARAAVGGNEPDEDDA